MRPEERIYRVKSISELHDIAGVGKPKHPLISVVDFSKAKTENAPESGRFVCEFYSVNFKNNCSFLYGRQFFDHEEGTLLCTAPEQVIQMQKTERTEEVTGWGLFFHPEFIRNTSLGRKIEEYTFFRYEENEALHLSSDEKDTLTTILRQIEREYQTNIDRHSHDLLISNLELLLNYCKRFYDRQFITRTNQNKDIVARFEQFLTEYVRSGELKNSGLPSVKFCAEKMNLSANYFSDLLKNETGKNAQEHIHFYLLDRAKTLLLSTNNTVNEIAFELGFEYPQNLTKLFKSKTGITPTEYRKIQATNN
jgi:AraC-like DNA-binding protein